MKITHSTSSNTPIAARPADTREYMMKLSGRGYAQVRHILVQLPNEEASRASTLARIVTGRHHRELLLYLLLLSCWNWLSKNVEPLNGAVWIRALTAPGAVTWSSSTLSRAWKRLEELDLIEKRQRNDRLVLVTPRREDGVEAYTPPAGREDRWNTYFTIPDEFWTEEIFAKLSLPALGILLVVLKETSYQKETWFTYASMDDWYGLKSRTVQNGVKELTEYGLLRVRKETITAPLAPLGTTTRSFYSLTGEFSYASRKSRQKKARTETRSRAQKSRDPKPR